MCYAPRWAGNSSNVANHTHHRPSGGRMTGLRTKRIGTFVVAGAFLLLSGAVGHAQLSGVSNSTVGAACGGGCNADGCCSNSVQFPGGIGATSFTSRYAWNINADVGVGATRDTTGTGSHHVDFTATAPGSYTINITTSRFGDINKINDLAGCSGSADTTGVTGASNIALNSGTLTLGDPGGFGNNGNTEETVISQSTPAVIGPRLSNGIGQGHNLTFTWSGNVRSNSCEAAVRQGENSGATTGCSACGYGGSPGCTQSSDGHFVAVLVTSFCGDN